MNTEASVACGRDQSDRGRAACTGSASDPTGIRGIRGAGLLLGFAMSLAAFQAFATDLDPAGRSWHIINEDETRMVVVGRDEGGAGRFPSVLVVTIHARPKMPLDGFVAYDYDLALVDLDCETEGRYRRSALHLHRLGQRKALSSDTEVSNWLEPTRFSFLGGPPIVRKEWSIGCHAGSAGVRLQGAQTYDGMVLAYRQRLDRQRDARLADLEAKRQAELEPVVARAARGIVPETSLESATRSAHWHGGRVPSGALLAWDQHGAKAGSRPGLKRMSHVTFLIATTPPWELATPDRPPMDFMVSDSEFDCAVPGKQRKLATARYVMLGGAARPTRSTRTPDSEWTTEGVGAYLWNRACGEGTESNPLPASTPFDELLELHRSTQGKSG